MASKRSEATYPLPRLLLLGPIFRSPGQREGVGRERILERPPLPWRVSRGATGVKTPDNQSGILKPLGQRRYIKKKKTKQNPKTHTSLLFGGSQGQPWERLSVWSWRPTGLERAAHDWRVDSWTSQRGLTASGLSRFEAKQRTTDSPVDRPGAKCAWGRG